MKYAIFLLSFLSITAQAHIKVKNADDWKVNFIPKDTQESYLLGGADFSLTTPMHKAGVIPTVLVFKTPAPAASPRNVIQWRELVLKGKPDFKPEPGERVLVRDGVTRYIATFEQNLAKDSTNKIFIMAMVVDNELFVFSYQGSLGIYRAHFEDIFKLYRTISLANE